MPQLRIIEVSPRDGLQNEKALIPTDAKLRLIQNLLAAGLSEIEVTSFVSPKWVPQLADAADLWRQLPRTGTFSCLVPNMRGLQTAIEVGASRVALFTAASNAFTQKNINMSIQESLEVFAELVKTFRNHEPNGFVRGYVSTIFECPYAGRIEPEAVRSVVQELFDIGANEVSLGDTIGVGAPNDVEKVHQALQGIPKKSLVWHFHDTKKTAIANAAKAMELGYLSFDASAGGLGGCPYAPGASGNLATEDLVYLAERLGYSTGVNIEALLGATSEVKQLISTK